MVGSDGYSQFARGLQNYDLLVNRVDFEEFKASIEEMRGFPVATQYALDLWDMFKNPLELRSKLRGEFPRFMRILMGKVHNTMIGKHEDLVP